MRASVPPTHQCTDAIRGTRQRGMGVGYTGSAEQQVQRAVCREDLADGGTMVYDVIVIGAGLGGLTAGAKLAKEGKKILLIEQHTIPGGCATTFRRKDLKIEVGLHELDGLDPGDMKLRAFQDLGVLEHVEFVRLPEFYRLVKPGLDIVIPDDYEQAVAVLTERFPAEGDGIRKFFKVVLSLRKETSRMPRRKWLMGASMLLAPFLYPNLLLRERWTVGRFLDSLFKDEDLKIVLLATLSYYHHDPYSMSLHFFALAQGSFFSGGSYFIKGGSQELSDYLASVIEDHEGKIVYRRLVHEIVIEDGAAVGVRYGKSQDGAGNLMTARGKRIVANAAVPNVVEQLLHDAGAKAKLSAVVGSPEIAASITTVYLGFKKPRVTVITPPFWWTRGSHLSGTSSPFIEPTFPREPVSSQTTVKSTRGWRPRARAWPLSALLIAFPTGRTSRMSGIASARTRWPIPFSLGWRLFSPESGTRSSTARSALPKPFVGTPSTQRAQPTVLPRRRASLAGRG